MQLSSIEEALTALREGKPILVADDENRENEVDAIMAAQYATAEWVGWMIRYTSGYLCAPMTEQRANHLNLNLMATTNQDPFKTQYTISVDAAEGVTTGISAADRATTFRVLADNDSTLDSISRPGHVIPLRAHQNGVLDRRGHTEATVDLMKLAGLAPVGVIGEMTNEDGTMTRLAEAFEIGEKFGLPVITIDQIVKMN
jgi:3,4-dihydroxy 2-butanone 4-phosphate synthase/GTP cyclohydrolase II